MSKRIVIAAHVITDDSDGNLDEIAGLLAPFKAPGTLGQVSVVTLLTDEVCEAVADLFYLMQMDRIAADLGLTEFTKEET